MIGIDNYIHTHSDAYTNMLIYKIIIHPRHTHTDIHAHSHTLRYKIHP